MTAVHVLVPVKTFATAKSRLAGVLQADERAALAKAMLEDTLEVLANVTGLGGILLVTSDFEAARIGKTVGADVLTDPGFDLNEALTVGRDHLHHRYPAAGLLVLPADLPCLGADDVEVLLEGARAGADAVISPARDGDGTNALLTGARVPLRYSYGRGSFRKHLAGLRSAGVRPCIVETQGTGLDLDTSQDLETVRTSNARPRVKKVLSQLCRQPRTEFGEAL